MPLYLPMVIKADGVLIYQNQSVEVDEPDNDAVVDTVPGGRQGKAPGPAVTTITVTNAIPVAGADYDWELAKRNFSEVFVECQQIGSLKILKGQFLIDSFNQTSGSGQPTLQNVALSSVGSPAPIFE